MSEYEKLKQSIAEYEAIYGTMSYTGNQSRDAEYSELKRKLNKLKPSSNVVSQ